MVNLLVSLAAGASVVCTPGWRDGASFFRWAAQHGATWYSAVPSIHLAITTHVEHALMRTGTAPPHSIALARNCSAALSPAIAERLGCALGCTVLPTYAMSECVPICSNPRRGPIKLGSVGPPAGPEVLVLGSPPAAAPLPPPLLSMRAGPDAELTSRAGVEGEVCVRGGCVTAGYEPRPHLDPTFSAFLPGGYLRTGDKGRFDSDGYLFLTGRLKEFINRGGEKLSPLAVEDAAISMPQVRQCVAFSCPHAQLGEAVGLAVVPAAGEDRATLAQLRAHIAAARTIETKWLPEALVHVDATPAGPTGKPLRIGLAARLGLPELSHHGGGGVGRTWVAVRSGDADGYTLTSVEEGEDAPAASTGGDDGGLPQLAGVRSIALAVACLPALADNAVLMDAGIDSMTSVLLVDKVCLPARILCALC